MQLGAIEHMSFSAITSFAIKCKNMLESTRFRHEHATSETHETFAFDKEVNAVYFYSSAEILEPSLVAEENLFTIKLDESA